MDQHSDNDDDDDTSELPSCIESLASSTEQLVLLSKDVGEFYIKYLLSYGYTSEPAKLVDQGFDLRLEQTRELKTSKVPIKDLELNKLMKEPKKLETLDSLMRLLPFLSDLSLFVERCFATIEATMKRSTYYLNKSANNYCNSNILGEEEFQLPPETKIDPIFVALMDLMYSLISLDKTIELHTDIRESLKTFKNVCQLVIDSTNNNIDEIENLKSIPESRLIDLIEFINNIQITICNEDKSIFEQCMEHVQHLNLILSVDKTNKGYKNLRQHFEEYLVFYAENLVEPTITDSLSSVNQTKLNQTNLIYLVNVNLIPTLYMTEKPRRLFGLSSLFVLYSWIFKKNEKNLSKLIGQTLQKHDQCNLLHLLGSNCYIFLNDFLSKYLPFSTKLDQKGLKQLNNHNEQWLKLNVKQEFDRLTMKSAVWLTKFKSETLKMNLNTCFERPTTQVACAQVLIFEQGIKLAEEINLTIKNIMTTYLHFNKAITKNKLILMLRLVSLLKSIEASLKNNRLFVYNCFMNLEHSVRTEWRRLIESAQKRLVALKYSDKKLDTVSTLMISSICSKTEFLTDDRGRIILSLCLSMLIPSLTQHEINHVNQLMNFSNLRNFYERLYASSDCGYLYWSLNTFSTYYNYSFEEDPCLIDELKYFHLALDNVSSLFTCSIVPTWSQVNCDWLDLKRQQFMEKLANELVDQFKVEFLDKICQELEIELRLQTHRDLNLTPNDHNPFRRHLYNFKQIFARQAIFIIFNQVISLRYHVEQHLNKVCYNLTALAPADWFTYDSMINMAMHKYDLKFVNSQLPTQNLDQGLDLLDITRNLALFVSRYGYDLTNQLFVEKCSNRLSTSSASSMMSGVSILTGNLVASSTNQMLNVVQIKHISKSLQMHGYGLLNSSVNCTYQLMKRLINLFSRQFSDDKLRAILVKEQQLIHSASLNLIQDNKSPNMRQQQPTLNFEKANRMAKRFKLNATSLYDNYNNQVGLDFDSMRQSITQLGNLLAFIRILKSGALNCASKSVDYLPDLEDLSFLRLEKFVNNEFKGYQPTESLQKAAANFNQCLADFEENFSSKTNYFAIIINLFTKLLTDVEQHHSGTSRSELQSSESEMAPTDQSIKQQDRKDHLKLFYLSVPALTINFVDYIINCKERVVSRSSAGRFGALISDDGFPMGVAFLLTVLNQTKEFNKLEWFKQVREKLELDKKEVEHRIEDSRYEESLKQTSSMTLRRLNRFSLEYDTLDYILNSGLLFFRSSTFDYS